MINCVFAPLYKHPAYPGDQGRCGQNGSLLGGALYEGLHALSIAHHLASSTAANEKDAGEITVESRRKYLYPTS